MSLPTLFVKGSLYHVDPQTMKELSEYVPIEYILQWIQSRLYKTGMENRVLVLKSKTGSGKSSALPPAIFNKFIKGNKRGVGMILTQPRVLTTIEIVLDMIPYHKSLVLGTTIGWSTKNNKVKPNDLSLLVATIGTLADQLKTMTDSELCSRYQFILIDETHQRDIQTDITIFMLKNLLLRITNRPDCPFVILMSATFDQNKFLTYFNVPAETNFIEVEGSPFTKTEMWDWNEGRTVSDYTKAAVDVVRKIITENPDDDPSKADILIFLPGKAEMSDTLRYLNTYNAELAESGQKTFSPILIDGESVRLQDLDFRKSMRITTADQTIVVDKKRYTPTRRVIMSTNVAETGLTLNNLRYVIDAGYNRETEFNPVHGVHMLLTKPAPQSRIIQRLGRAGRKFPGVFYPLYPKWIYDKLQVFQYADILVNDVSSMMLDAIAEQMRASISVNKPPVFVLADLDLLDLPSPDALCFSLEKLYSLGYIAPNAPEWKVDFDEFINSPAINSHNANSTGYSNSTTYINSADSATSPHLSITKLGAIARLLSSETLEASRMILAGYSWNVSILDLIAIDVWLALDGKKKIRQDTTKDANWITIYKSAIPSLSITNIIEKMRTLICDEFIDGILFFNALKRTIANVSHKSLFTTLRKWCNNNNINYKFCISFISTRDDVIEGLTANKLDVFSQEEHSLYNVIDSIDFGVDDLTKTICKIKHCIYDGYRNNIIIRQAEFVPPKPTKPSHAGIRANSPHAKSLHPNSHVKSSHTNSHTSTLHPNSHVKSSHTNTSHAKPSHATRVHTADKARKGGSDQSANEHRQNEQVPLYRTRTGLVVKTPSIIGKQTQKNPSLGRLYDLYPQYAIASSFTTKFNRETLMFDVNAACVSVLDGYMSPDLSFLM